MTDELADAPRVATRTLAEKSARVSPGWLIAAMVIAETLWLATLAYLIARLAG